jgi:hypothetical protein
MEREVMVSLTELVPMTKSVHYGDKEIPVWGISAEVLAHLLTTTPELKMILAERELGKDIMQSLLTQAPEVLAQIIAAGVGKIGNDAEIAAARKLPAGLQAQLIAAIVDCTFPQSLTSFIEGLAGFLESVGAPVGPIKGAVGKSLAPSNIVSEQDIR